MVVQRRFPTEDIIDVLFFARNKNRVELFAEQPQTRIGSFLFTLFAISPRPELPANS